MTRSILVALATLVLAACSGTLGGVLQSPGPGASPPSGSTAGTSVPAHCTARGTGLQVLPDPVCTPGATDSRVTQANIQLTICRTGYTSTVRPPESYTEPLKRQLVQSYGETGALSRYELDHLVPLELGGHPTSVANLWPEPGASPNSKDRVELAANRAVCSGRLALADAQREMAADWTKLGAQLGVS